MRKWIFFLGFVFLPGYGHAIVISSVTVRQFKNPLLSNEIQYLTVIDTSSVQAGSGISVVATSSGVVVSATGAAGGGGGSSSLEVFNNFDATRTSPTASISLSNDFSGIVSGSTYGISVKLQKLGSPQYFTLQDFLNSAMSAGRIAGGLITDTGSGNVNVASGTGFIKSLDSDTTTNYFFAWPSSSTISIPTNTTRYLGVGYSAGTPVVFVKSVDTWDLDTEFPLGIVVNQASRLYIATVPWVTSDNMTNVIERFDAMNFVSRDNRTGGLIVSNSGTRNVAVTAGTLLARMGEFTVGAVDTSLSGTFDHYYRDGAGGWVVQVSSTQWNNTQYDNNSGTLQSITALSYASRWWYLMLDGTVACLYGQNTYTTLAGALNDGTPSSVPDRILKMGALIGRFIIQASGVTPSVTQSSFGTAFTASAVTNFSDLAGTADISTQTNLAVTAPITLTNDTIGITASTGAIGILIDGGGSAIVAGSTRSITVPFGCTISSWTVVADQSGSISVHISTSSFSDYPTLYNISGAGNSPGLVSQQKKAGSPSSWTSTSVTQGTIVSFVIDSASTITWANIILWALKT